MKMLTINGVEYPSILAAIDQVSELNKERSSAYGHPTRAYELIAALVAPLEDCDDEILKHVLYMILVKVARLIVTPDHGDSWLDIVGYARTAAMVLDKRVEDYHKLNKKRTNSN